jgi:hypothetical protein
MSIITPLSNSLRSADLTSKPARDERTINIDTILTTTSSWICASQLRYNKVIVLPDMLL